MNLITLWVIFSRLWIVARLLIRVATIVLGASVLVWVVDRCRGTDAELVIHVAEPDVVLTVGDQSFTVRGQEPRPIVCEVEPGSHVLTLRRDDRVLYQESVTVDPGESRVCTAYDVERIRALTLKAAHLPSRRNSLIGSGDRRSGTRRSIGGSSHGRSDESLAVDRGVDPRVPPVR